MVPVDAKGWKEASLCDAIGRWVYSEEHGFAFLTARAVRFFAGGVPVGDGGLLWRKGDGGEWISAEEVCAAFTRRELTYGHLLNGTVEERGAGMFWRLRAVPVAYDGMELECVLAVPGRVVAGTSMTFRTARDGAEPRFLLAGEPLRCPEPSEIRAGMRLCLAAEADGSCGYVTDGDAACWMPELGSGCRQDVTVTQMYEGLNPRRLCDVQTRDGKTVRIDRAEIGRLSLMPDVARERHPARKLSEQEERERGELAARLARAAVRGWMGAGAREAELSPFSVREGQTANICWQEVRDAASYRVTLLRRGAPGRAALYHMADYETDRNTHFVSVPGLVGGGIMFRVSALGRDGRTLARSRCEDI